MSLRLWALKVGELRPLSPGQVLLLAARCALRVEPWVPPGAEALWQEGLEAVVAAAGGAPAVPRDLARALSDRGAVACNRLTATDEPLGRCMNYATSTLAAAIEATRLPAGTPAKKAVIQTAKLSTAIPAVLAHAGRVRVPAGEDPVEVACLAAWDAVRRDIPTLVSAGPELEATTDRVGALRVCGPLWIHGVPEWVPT